jgi:hypothetical protein
VSYKGLFCTTVGLIKNNNNNNNNNILAVALYEKGSMESVLGRSESVSGIANEENSNDFLHIQEPTTSKNRYQNEISEYLNDSRNNDVTIIRKREREEIILNTRKDNTSTYCTYRSNGKKSRISPKIQDFMDMFRSFKNQVEKKRSNEVSKRQKIEKQTDYPNKK